MYKCLKRSIIQDAQGYQIVCIRAEDVESIRQWRNAQQEVLRQQTPLSFEKQKKYFATHIWPSLQEEYPKQILFSYLYNGQCIGYGGLTHIDWESQRGEVSFLLDTARTANETERVNDFTHFLKLLQIVCFEELAFHRLFAEIFSFRLDYIRVLENQGFKLEGVLRDHTYKQNQWWDSLLYGQLNSEWRTNI